MVMLYHGTNQLFRKPVPSKGRMCTDFGRGFYLTPNFETARRIALRSVDFSVVGRPVVLSFEFDHEKALQELRTKTFARIDIPWTKFVIANRKRDVVAVDHNIDGRYDVVHGPVADDRLVRLLMKYDRGLMTLEELRTQLALTQRGMVQYSFHTPAAVKCLNFKEAAYVC